MFENYREAIKRKCIERGHSPPTVELLNFTLRDGIILQSVKDKLTLDELVGLGEALLRHQVGEVVCSRCGATRLKSDCQVLGKSRERQYHVCVTCEPWRM